MIFDLKNAAHGIEGKMTLARDEWLSDKLRYVVVSIGGIDTPLDRHRHHHHTPSLLPVLS
jgi:hypothetical protein